MFVPDKPFQTSLMFVSKAGGPESDSLGEGGFNRTDNNWTRLERLARDKHSSLLEKFEN